MPDRTIVAMGGGGFSDDDDLLDDFIVSLASVDRPRICFLPTATDNVDRYSALFYRAFARRKCEPSDLSLFAREIEDLEGFLLSQDVIYVGGGNTANMLAVWRVHGVDQILRRAWEQGVVLCGMSAGANCWFETSVTDSFGPTLAPLADGLAFLPGSFCPHYDGEPQRRPAYELLVSKGFPAGYAADDNAALRFADTDLVECVSSKPDAAVYRVELVDGEVTQTAVETRFLG
jgi:dipeptidase E